MSKKFFVALPILAIFAIPVSAREHKDWCTDAHMQKMDAKIAGMADAKMKQSAQMHLDMSKAEMKKNNIDGCVEHMKEAHKAMGM